MQKNIALSMKDHYLNYYRHYDGYRLEELNIKKRGYNLIGNIKFLFDRSNADLVITGDYGYAIFSWFSDKYILEDLQDLTGAWGFVADHCLAASRPLYVYKYKQAIVDIRNWLYCVSADQYDWQEEPKLSTFSGPDDLVVQLTNCIDDRRGFDLDNSPVFNCNKSDIEEAIEFLDPDYWEVADSWGKTLSDDVKVWTHALDLGIRWKKQQEKEN